MDDDVRAAANAMANDQKHPAYAPMPPKSPQQRSFKKLPVIILMSAVILGAAGFIIWKTVQKDTPVATPATSSNQEESSAQKTQPSSDVPDSSASETYQSNALSVAFKHPTTWKVSEANGGIRVESPSFTFPSRYQGEVSGNFRIYIRQGARKVDGTYIGRGYAVKPSEKLVYTQPAVGQRSETLLSSFGYDTTDNFAFFLIAGNFQLAPGDTLGPDYGKEAETYIITGGYASPSAVDDLSAIPVSLNYYQTTNAYRQALAILGSLQLK